MLVAQVLDIQRCRDIGKFLTDRQNILNPIFFNLVICIQSVQLLLIIGPVVLKLTQNLSVQQERVKAESLAVYNRVEKLDETWK